MVMLPACAEFSDDTTAAKSHRRGIGQGGCSWLGVGDFTPCTPP